MSGSKTVLWAMLAAVLLAAAPASAQEQPDSNAGTEGQAEPVSEDEAFLTDTKTEEEQLLSAPEEEAGTGRAEDPEAKIFSVGARLRWIMVPSWFIGMFGVDIKGAPHLIVNNIGAGAEFTYRKDGFDITAAVWYIGLDWDGGISFKGSDEDGNSWEVVQNEIRGILISADFIWSTSITDWFAITYGAGIGLGIPVGDIIRTEATESSDGLFKCTGQNDPDEWCGTDEEYEYVYDVPTGIIPWINFLGGMRFKPHRHVAIYTDFGFGLGFQAGVRAGYIF